MNTIYIGANNELARTNQIFRDCPQEIIARLKAAYPLIPLLFVTAEELTLARKEIAQVGSARNRAYQQSLEKRDIPAQIPLQPPTTDEKIKAR